MRMNMEDKRSFITDFGEKFMDSLTLEAKRLIHRYAVWQYDARKDKHQVLESADSLSELLAKHQISRKLVFKIGAHTRELVCEGDPIDSLAHELYNRWSSAAFDIAAAIEHSSNKIPSPDDVFNGENYFLDWLGDAAHDAGVQEKLTTEQRMELKERTYQLWRT